jgi:hypothetical protein
MKLIPAFENTNLYLGLAQGDALRGKAIEGLQATSRSNDAHLILADLERDRGLGTARGFQPVDSQGIEGWRAAIASIANGSLTPTSPRLFDADSYRAKNPDVAQGVLYENTLNHYLAYGIAEGRQT